MRLLCSVSAIRTVTSMCPSFLFSSRNVGWPRCMLPSGESRWVCRRTDRHTDERTPHYAFLSLDADSVIMAMVVCLCLCVVTYTMDTMYFESLETPVDVAEDVQMPQFSLVDSKVIDCSINYTSGFCSLIYMSTSCLDWLLSNISIFSTLQ